MTKAAETMTKAAAGGVGEGTYYETHDLKQRGWTEAMIKNLLGRPDATRESELRVGWSRRRAGGEVKRYRRARVEEIEASEDFELAQQKAADRRPSSEKAQATRRARETATIEAFLAKYPEQLTAPTDGIERTNKQRWDYHQWELTKWEGAHDAPLYQLPPHVASQARLRLYCKHHDAYHRTYPPLPPPAE